MNRSFVLALALVACAPDAPTDAPAAVPDARRLGLIPAFGLRADGPTFDPARFGVAPEALPAAVDWRDLGGRSYLGPVRDQGQAGTCVAFAATAAVEASLDIQADAGGLDLSEQWLVDTCGPVSPEEGYYLEAIGNDIVALGMVDEADHPYVAAEAPCPARLEADPALAVGASWFVDSDDFKAAVVASPIVVGMEVYSDFYDYTSGVYRVAPTATLEGYHAVLLVGYDDARQAWILRNSWGESWGDGGYFLLAYDEAALLRELGGVLLEIADGDPTRGAHLVGVGTSDEDGDGASRAEDCDDHDAAVYPGALDDCEGDGLDNDCDGEIDEDGFETAWPDADGDGYGDTEGEARLCHPGEGTSDRDGDCDDTNPHAHPGSLDATADGVDDDCDGTYDENAAPITWAVPTAGCSTAGGSASWVLLAIAPLLRRRARGSR